MALSESDDSSLNSMDIDCHPQPLNEDSDTGLESMSSAETPHKLSLQCPLCGGHEDGVCALHADPEIVMQQVETLKQDNKLKFDERDLLRQNVVQQVSQEPIVHIFVVLADFYQQDTWQAVCQFRNL